MTEQWFITGQAVACSLFPVPCSLIPNRNCVPPSYETCSIIIDKPKNNYQ
ncbi:MAG: hypothetical protein F6J98_36420 [Moorea sp. SIO4G2]|nr:MULTISPECIES: hypothetical protein [unclassified Moorena]NEO16398.1 hypothetical protein [Moorena sp. SIO3E8]NEO65587.1 hypothetical protein [Moorena sp. SIO4G2]NEQ04226.1 hypothetical protein [Moorena sp. SIO3F7]